MSDRPTNPILERHKKHWKNCWDFLGGTKSWDEALKRWNAAQKAAKKKVEATIEEMTPGGSQ